MGTKTVVDDPYGSRPSVVRYAADIDPKFSHRSVHLYSVLIYELLLQSVLASVAARSSAHRRMAGSRHSDRALPVSAWPADAHRARQ